MIRRLERRQFGIVLERRETFQAPLGIAKNNRPSIGRNQNSERFLVDQNRGPQRAGATSPPVAFTPGDGHNCGSRIGPR